MPPPARAGSASHISPPPVLRGPARITNDSSNSRTFGIGSKGSVESALVTAQGLGPVFLAFPGAFNTREPLQVVACAVRRAQRNPGCLLRIPECSSWRARVRERRLANRDVVDVHLKRPPLTICQPYRRHDPRAAGVHANQAPHPDKAAP